MLYEPSTLASTTALLATSLGEEYGIDAEAVFSRAGLPLPPADSPQLRYPLAKIRELWALSLEATGDEAIGLKTGWYAKPTHFYAFGYSWLASSTLLGAMQRLTRYFRVLSTSVVDIGIRETEDSYALTAAFPDPSRSPPKEGIDCGLTALLALCEAVAEKPVRPIRVDLTCAADVHPEAYRTALAAPLNFGCDTGAFYFDKATLEARLPNAAPDIAKATDSIAELYMETLDPRKVASQVRRLLIELLPTGKVDQAAVSSRLNRSPSSLQRQLQAEGVSYREVLESTRRNLAESYLRKGRHSQAQIAYLLGFSEQSNFCRAFRRWNSMSPRQFQASVEEPRRNSHA